MKWPKKKETDSKVGSKRKEQLSKIQRLAKTIEMDTRKKKRKQRQAREDLSTLPIIRQPVPIKQLPGVSPATEDHPFAYCFDKQKRGWLSRVGIGSASVLLVEWDDDREKRRFNQTTISLESKVFPLRQRRKRKTKT